MSSWQENGVKKEKEAFSFLLEWSFYFGRMKMSQWTRQLRQVMSERTGQGGGLEAVSQPVSGSLARKTSRGIPQQLSTLFITRTV